MLTVSCPRCGNIHFADEVHSGKFLKCANCGDAVQIGAISSNQIEAFGPAVEVAAKSAQKRNRLRALRTGIWKRRQLVLIGVFLIIATISSLLYFRPRKEDILDEVSATGKPVEPKPDEYETAHAADAKSLRRSCSPHVAGDRMVLESRARGRGKLVLINGTGEDSVVLVVNNQSGEIARSIYVPAGSTGTIDRVAVGEYWIRATLGNCWSDADETFADGASYFTFPHPYKFSEEERGDEVQSDRLSLTLHPVLNGNIQKMPISKAQFWAPSAIPR